jgi:hypothetical protein
MGNQPSSSATPLPPSNPPPPLPPSCDLDCQRQKQLSDLKYALDLAEKTKSTDPEGYQQARIKYYTLLEGQGWLAKEKESIARSELDPLISEYTAKYEELKSAKKSQSIFANLAGALKTQAESDEHDNNFLKKQISKGVDQTNTLNRMSQLTGIPAGFTFLPYLSIILDIVIGILAIVIVYMLYSRFFKTAQVEQVVSAGKRR